MWGTTPDVFDRATPKIAAIHALEGAAQTRDVGSAVPGTLAATAYQFQAAPGGYAQPAYYYFRSGAALAYLVEARAAGTYRLTLRVASYATAAGQATILRDGRSAGTLVTPPTGGNPNAPVTTAALAVALPQGLSVLEVAETRGEFALYGVALAK